MTKLHAATDLSSPMRGRSVSGTDPAHEIGKDGRTLLQRRLAVYYLVLLGFYCGYWPFFYLIWSNDARFGPEPALRHVFAPTSLLLGLLYVVWAAVFRLRVWSVARLGQLDVLSTACVGLCYQDMIRTLPSAVNGPLEGCVAVMSVLSIRALLVPSSWQRSALAGFALTLPCIVMVFVERQYYSGQSVSFTTLAFNFVNWSVIAIVYSAFASNVLYGLRRDVSQARKLGQYTLLEKLGAGGMGVVYRAQHALLRRPTAIKLLGENRGEQGLVRFEREVQLMAELKHPNTVTVHDYGRTADGVFYYAMEYLDGLDMEGLVELGGAQCPARVIHLLRQACGALHEAHARGLIHRDIKPANVFVCREHGLSDMVKVLDFWVAKQLMAAPGVPLRQAELPADLSREQALVGTPLYLSPEAINAPNAMDGRSDLYSLGAVGYMLLTGRPVFSGATVMEICAHHLFTEPEPPSQRAADVPHDLERVLLRCLAKAPAQRFANAEALRAALDGCRDAHGWNQDAARRWWGEHQQRIEARRARGVDSRTALDQTIAVDGNQRA